MIIGHIRAYIVCHSRILEKIHLARNYLSRTFFYSPFQSTHIAIWAIKKFSCDFGHRITLAYNTPNVVTVIFSLV
jgi:hypothetical protein